MGSSRWFVRWAVMTFWIGFLLSGPLIAQGYQELECDEAHGCCPEYPNAMAQATDGNLYGTTPTVVRITSAPFSA